MVAQAMRPKEKVKTQNLKSVTHLIDTFKGDVGFTEEEIMIIVATSLDQEHLTNLILN